MWRYFEVLPVHDQSNVVTLGEGYTPLLRADRLRREIGCGPLLIKDEGVNPTSSFKARGLSTAVSKAKELGVKALTIPTAGNAGGALAAYAARAGMVAHVFMPADAPEANRKEVEVMGARLTLVDGLIGDAGALSRRMASEHGLFDVSTLQEPYRAEGKKTMGYEIAEQMGWRMPDVIVYPTGGGTGIVGIWKAIQEMETMGLLNGQRPRMFCVQAEGCAPIVRAFHSGADHAEPWQNARTLAAGIRVPSAIGDYLILNALRESKGGAVTVSDDEIVDWMGRVSSLEGIFVCPEGAATAAALSKLGCRRLRRPGRAGTPAEHRVGGEVPGDAVRAGRASSDTFMICRTTLCEGSTRKIASPAWARRAQKCRTRRAASRRSESPKACLPLSPERNRSLNSAIVGAGRRGGIALTGLCYTLAESWLIATCR